MDRKLDRVTVNEHWFSDFGYSLVEFLALGVSDHSLALVSMGEKNFGQPFNFFNFWADNQHFLEWVEHIGV